MTAVQETETSASTNYIDEKTFLETVSRLENQIASLQSKQNEQQESTKITSFKQLRSEIGAFLSLNGYSRVLRTNSLLKKIVWLTCALALISYCMFLVNKNYSEYKEANVITNIKYIENDSLLFPAVTICIQEYKSQRQLMLSHNLSDVLVDCSFEGSTKCSASDFIKNFHVFYPFFNTHFNCYQFNGDAKYTATIFGKDSGLLMEFNLLKDYLIFYFISEAKMRPTTSELSRIVQPGQVVFAQVEKTVDIKLPKPYSNCRHDINPETSHLVRQILEKNMTYRKVFCYDLCLNEYASLNNITKKDAYTSLGFNYRGNCSGYCPLECELHRFEVTENEIMLDTSESGHKLWLNFFYSSNRYTEIRQSVQTTQVDLIANTGGVLGLFLEISFISAYRFFCNIFDFLV